MTVATRVRALVTASILTAVSGCATVPPSDTSPRAVVEAKFAAVNRHAIADIVALYSPDGQVTASDFCQPRRGRADVQRTYQYLFDTFPDIVADVHEYIVERDRVAVRFTARGQVRGQSFNLPIANFFTVRNGLIESDDGVFDTRGRPCSP